MLVSIIKNNKIDDYLGHVRLSKGQLRRDQGNRKKHPLKLFTINLNPISIPESPPDPKIIALLIIMTHDLRKMKGKRQNITIAMNVTQLALDVLAHKKHNEIIFKFLLHDFKTSIEFEICLFRYRKKMLNPPKIAPKFQTFFEDTAPDVTQLIPWN